MLKKACLLGAIVVVLATLQTNLGASVTNYLVENYEYSCYNASILPISINSTNGTAWDYFAYNISCPNGCENNLGKYGADCVEPDYIVILIVIAGIVGLFIFLVWAGRK